MSNLRVSTAIPRTVKRVDNTISYEFDIAPSRMADKDHLADVEHTCTLNIEDTPFYYLERGKCIVVLEQSDPCHFKLGTEYIAVYNKHTVTLECEEGEYKESIA